MYLNSLTGFGAGRSSSLSRIGVSASTTAFLPAFPPGTVPGSLVLVMVTYSGNVAPVISGGDGGWVSEYIDNSFFRLTCLRKKVTAADISAASSGTLSVGAAFAILVAAYRKTNLASMATGYTGANNAVAGFYDVPGFVKNPADLGYVFFAYHSDNNVDYTLSNGGSSFTKIIEYDPSSTTTHAVWELLRPPLYVDGTAIRVSMPQHGWDLAICMALR